MHAVWEGTEELYEECLSRECVSIHGFQGVVPIGPCHGKKKPCNQA